VNYQEILDYLYSLGHEVLNADYRMERIRRLLAALEHPERAYPIILIAGTNGKGSVAAMIESILRRAGWRAGLFTSPHLVNICERIRIAGEMIPRRAFARYATRVHDIARHLLMREEIPTMPTFFEHVTAAGFSYFRDRGVDLAVIEVGLGGRLDATNTTAPLIAVLTGIDFDHEKILGPTLEAIAAEKAAIIKPGTIVVTAPQRPEVLSVIERRCRECGVTFYQAVDDPSRLRIRASSPDGRFAFSYRSRRQVYENVRLALPGRHQIENALVAIEVAEALSDRGYRLPPRAIVEGLQTVSWPGRLEWLRHHGSSSDGRSKASLLPAVLLDGAHNLAGVRALSSYLRDFARRPLTLLFSAMRDKRIEEMAAMLFPLADRVILTRIDDPRAVEPARLNELAHTYRHARLIEPIRSALSHALAITPPEGMIGVTGSLYLVGAVRAAWFEMTRSVPAKRAATRVLGLESYHR